MNGDRLIGWRTWAFSVVGLASGSALCYFDKLASVEYLTLAGLYVAIYGVVRTKTNGGQS